MTLVGFKKMTIGIFDEDGKILINLLLKVNKIKGPLYPLKLAAYQKKLQRYMAQILLTISRKKEQGTFLLRLDC